MHDLLAHLESLSHAFGESAMAVLLLQILTCIYPPLAAAGAAFWAPLGIMVRSEEHLKSVLQVLTIFEELRMVSMLKSPKEFRKSIDSEGCLAKMIRFARGRYTDINMEELLAKCDDIGATGPPVLYLIFFVGGVPQEYAGCCSGIIYLKEGTEKRGALYTEQIVSPIIHDLINDREYLQNAGCRLEKPLAVPEMQALVLSAHYLYQFALQQGYSRAELDSFTEKMETTLNQFAEEWTGAECSMVYVEAFRKQTIQLLNSFVLYVCDRLEVGADALDNLEQTIFFDDLFYYMPYSAFAEICNPICASVSLDYLKDRLSDAGLLVMEEGQRRYYTKEIELVTVYGYVMRKRLVKLQRRLLDRDGEATLLELLHREGGDICGGSETWTNGGNLQLSEYCK